MSLFRAYFSDVYSLASQKRSHSFGTAGINPHVQYKHNQTRHYVASKAYCSSCRSLVRRRTRAPLRCNIPQRTSALRILRRRSRVGRSRPGSPWTGSKPSRLVQLDPGSLPWVFPVAEVWVDPAVLLGPVLGNLASGKHRAKDIAGRLEILAAGPSRFSRPTIH